MATTGVLAHQDLYAVLNAGPFNTVGENILMNSTGYTTADMELAWMNSPPHRANILSGAYQSMGIGIATGANGMVFTSVLFSDAAPNAQPPSAILPPKLTGSAGELTPVVPARILDTRDGTGRNGLVAQLGPQQQLDLTVTGVGGVPATGVEAVVLNVTVTGPTAPGWLAVWPTGAARPLVSNLNFSVGQSVPNLVMVQVGSSGRVSFYNQNGATDVVADVVGWYATTDGLPGGRFHATVPARILDTRAGLGAAGPVPSGGSIQLKVTGNGGVPASGVTAVVMNVTVTQPTAAGFITVHPDNAARPLASNLNFVPDETVPNLVLVSVPPSGVIDLYNSNGASHLVADVVGWYDTDRSTNAGRFVPITPFRLADTRNSGQPLGPTGIAGFSIEGTAPLPGSGLGAVVANITVTQPTDSGYLTAYPEDANRPLASNLNFLPDETVPNLAAVKVSGNGRIALVQPRRLHTRDHRRVGLLPRQQRVTYMRKTRTRWAPRPAGSSSASASDTRLR